MKNTPKPFVVLTTCTCLLLPSIAFGGGHHQADRALSSGRSEDLDRGRLLSSRSQSHLERLKNIEERGERLFVSPFSLGPSQITKSKGISLGTDSAAAAKKATDHFSGSIIDADLPKKYSQGPSNQQPSARSRSLLLRSAPASKLAPVHKGHRR